MSKKKWQKQGISLVMKIDKPQAVGNISSVNGRTLKNSTYGTSKTLKIFTV